MEITASNLEMEKYKPEAHAVQGCRTIYIYISLKTRFHGLDSQFNPAGVGTAELPAGF